MFATYAPLSNLVSPFLPDNLSNILPCAEISVSGFYVREDLPHIVLKHCSWDSRAHFLIRWVLHLEQSSIALLEQVSSVSSKTKPRQIFVRVNSRNSVTFISQPEFMRVLQLVCSDIVAHRVVGERDKKRKLLEDVKRIFWRSRRRNHSSEHRAFDMRSCIY